MTTVPELRTGTHEFAAGDRPTPAGGVGASCPTRSTLPGVCPPDTVPRTRWQSAPASLAPARMTGSVPRPMSLALGPRPRVQRRPAPAPLACSAPAVRPGLGRCEPPKAPTPPARHLFFTTRLCPVPPSGRPALAECAGLPYTHCLTALCLQAWLVSPYTPAKFVDHSSFLIHGDNGSTPPLC